MREELSDVGEKVRDGAHEKHIVEWCARRAPKDEITIGTNNDNNIVRIVRFLFEIFCSEGMKALEHFGVAFARASVRAHKNRLRSLDIALPYKPPNEVNNSLFTLVDEETTCDDLSWLQFHSFLQRGCCPNNRFAASLALCG